MMGPAAMMVLAGLTSVVDWIGSSVEYFPVFCPNGKRPSRFEPQEYLEIARTRARAALTRLAWIGWEPPSAALPFQELFPGSTERPVQRVVRELVDDFNGPGLVGVEAKTGSGKTEAALGAAESLFARGGHEGLYFALPTRATSDQMFKRVRRFLSRRYPRERVSLHLLHGSAAMSVDYSAPSA
jgi:CRISPR-associated endonuclease/helicase Cas3